MKQYDIPLSKPSLTLADFHEIEACFKSSWISSKSSWVIKFEKSFAKTVSHTKYAVSVNSGTSALFLILKGLGIGPGDEVILPTFTMIATVNAVIWTGATPILVDCESKEDWNISSEAAANKISKKTKAIIAVHIYGYLCNMNALVKIAKQNNLILIEDAAEAMGSLYKNRRAGSMSAASCFSLYSNKIISTGNGGIVATNSHRLYLLLQKLRFFDFDAKSHFMHRIIGYNLVLSGLPAALGFSQTKRFDKLLKKRRLIFQWYTKHLVYSNVHFLRPRVQTNPNYWFPAIILSSTKDVRNVEKSLEKNKIETRCFFRPIHKQPILKDMFSDQRFPNANYFWSHGLLLPSFNSIKEGDVKKISEIISASLG